MKMLALVAAKLAQAVAVFFAVSALTFLLVHAAPGDFLSEMRLDPNISPDTLREMRSRLGLDDPLPLQYWRWLTSIARGEFGYSFSYNAPIGPMLAERARNTLLLTVSATAIAWLLAFPLGIWSAYRRGRVAERLGSGATTAFLATPDLLLALGALYLASRTGWFPAGGMSSIHFSDLDATGKLADLARHMALPVTVLTLGTLPILVRHVRTAVVEVMEMPFIRAAEIHGVCGFRLLFRHIIPAAANPLISLGGLTLAGLLSGSLMVEYVMAWPGIGPLLIEAILARDVYVVLGAVMISTLFLGIGAAGTDVALAVLDPRVRRRS